MREAHWQVCIGSSLLTRLRVSSPESEAENGLVIALFHHHFRARRSTRDDRKRRMCIRKLFSLSLALPHRPPKRPRSVRVRYLSSDSRSAHATARLGVFFRRRAWELPRTSLLSSSTLVGRVGESARRGHPPGRKKMGERNWQRNLSLSFGRVVNNLQVRETPAPEHVSVLF